MKEKQYRISFIMRHVKSTKGIDRTVLYRIRGMGRGSVSVASDFLDLARRPMVDLALHRLAKKKAIRRLARGVYDFPKQHPVLGPISPSADTIAHALAGSGPYAASTCRGIRGQ